MGFPTSFIPWLTICAGAFFWSGVVPAFVSGPEMPSRVKLSGVPEERVTLRSQTAPITSINLAPTAEQLQAAGQKKVVSVPSIASILGLNEDTVRRPVPLAVGAVFPSGVGARVVDWEPVAGGGHVTHFRITSLGAQGIRARLMLPPGLTEGDLRVVGRPGDLAEGVPLHVAQNGDIWTPFTDGQTQIVELFTAQPVAGLVLKVADVGHYEVSPYALNPPPEPAIRSAASACTVDVACAISDDPFYGNSIAERRKSVARMSFASGGRIFLCTGTLINSSAQQDFFLTANHCISTQAEATSLETRWFYEASACGGTVRSDVVSRSGGAQLVFTNQFQDYTLLRLNLPPPPGTVFAGWDANALPVNSQVISLSHPDGDLMKFARGIVSVPGVSDGLLRTEGYDQPMYGVLWSRGITEGGSSGSGLFTLSSGSLQLRGTLYVPRYETMRTGHHVPIRQRTTSIHASITSFRRLHPFSTVRDSLRMMLPIKPRFQLRR